MPRRARARLALSIVCVGAQHDLGALSRMPLPPGALRLGCQCVDRLCAARQPPIRGTWTARATQSTARALAARAGGRTWATAAHAASSARCGPSTAPYATGAGRPLGEPLSVFLHVLQKLLRVVLEQAETSRCLRRCVERFDHHCPGESSSYTTTVSVMLNRGLKLTGRVLNSGAQLRRRAEQSHLCRPGRLHTDRPGAVPSAGGRICAAHAGVASGHACAAGAQPAVIVPEMHNLLRVLVL